MIWLEIDPDRNEEVKIYIIVYEDIDTKEKGIYCSLNAIPFHYEGKRIISEEICLLRL